MLRSYRRKWIACGQNELRTCIKAMHVAKPPGCSSRPGDDGSTRNQTTVHFMKRLHALLAALCIATSLAAEASQGSDSPKIPVDAALAPVADVAGLPRVLIIGDSISIGYTLPVRELLSGKATVHRIPGNASSTANGLKRLKEWLGSNKWDVIYFNFGLHDAKLPPEGVGHSSLTQYDKNLRELVSELKATGAKLIWATTTPVPNGGNLAPNRRFADVAAYNAVAAKVMRENGVVIDDLNALITPNLARLQRSNDVHFTAEGSALLARQVAKCIQAQLVNPPTPAPGK